MIGTRKVGEGRPPSLTLLPGSSCKLLYYGLDDPNAVCLWI
jgi:hypothetical protein